MAAGLRAGPERERSAADRAGLDVVDLRLERPRTVFDDIGAVVWLLRLVVWIVPGSTVDAHRDALRSLHAQIGATAASRRRRRVC